MPDCGRASVAWIGLGSNLESPAAQIERAIERLAAVPGLRLLARSRLYRTTPLGGPTNQPDFCNACAALSVRMSARQLLGVTQRVEREHGRVRGVVWGPRTLDLDILAFDDLRLSLARLELPHPRACERAFVLVPLAEIAPALSLAGVRVIDSLAALGGAGVQPWHRA